MEFDLIIIGAGPAGLNLARALRGSALRICLVEQQALHALQQPDFDGREIALTQHSASLLRQFGIWALLDAQHIAPLKDALVIDGDRASAQARMCISQRLSAAPELGYLVGNHHIRRASFAAALAAADELGAPPELRCNERVCHVYSDAQAAYVKLASGQTLRARLVVAADSRHSLSRRAMGIAADMHDYGRSMLLCNMTHERAHDQTAWQWFGHGQTLALLPMNPCPESGLARSSVVLTLPQRDLTALLDLPDDAFNAAMVQRFEGRLGAMTVTSSRHVYPLVGVWARHLVAQRFAVVGDAAVGMHPVTAHGFNLGLRSIETLSGLLIKALRKGQDIAAPVLLERYQRRHQCDSRGLFFATHAVATLYTREQAPARLLRQALLHLGERCTPFKRALAASLTG